MDDNRKANDTEAPPKATAAGKKRKADAIEVPLMALAPAKKHKPEPIEAPPATSAPAEQQPVTAPSSPPPPPPQASRKRKIDAVEVPGPSKKVKVEEIPAWPAPKTRAEKQAAALLPAIPEASKASQATSATGGNTGNEVVLGASEASRAVKTTGGGSKQAAKTPAKGRAKGIRKGKAVAEPRETDPFVLTLKAINARGPESLKTGDWKTAEKFFWIMTEIKPSRRAAKDAASTLPHADLDRHVAARNDAWSAMRRRERELEVEMVRFAANWYITGIAC